MNTGQEFSAQQAIGEIGRIDRQVRRSARRGPWWFLVVGVATILYLSIAHFAGDPVPEIAGLAWVVFSVVSAVYVVFRVPVYDRVLWRLQYPVTAIYLAAVITNVIVLDYVREGGGGWPVVVGVAAILFAAVPLFYGAWRSLKALEDRNGPVGSGR